MSNYNKAPQVTKIGGGRMNLQLEGVNTKFHLGAAILTEENISGVVAFASKNVLIIK